MSLHDSDHEGVVRIFVALSCELWRFFIYIIQVATAILVAGSTLTFWIPPFASTSSHSRVVKALGCFCNCRRLAYGLFQLTHMSRDDTLFNWSSHGGQDEDKTLLQRSQRCHKGAFRHVTISARQRSLRCGQNFRRPFLRATLPMTVGSCARSCSRVHALSEEAITSVRGGHVLTFKFARAWMVCGGILTMYVI